MKKNVICWLCGLMLLAVLLTAAAIGLIEIRLVWLWRAFWIPLAVIALIVVWMILGAMVDEVEKQRRQKCEVSLLMKVAQNLQNAAEAELVVADGHRKNGNKALMRERLAAGRALRLTAIGIARTVSPSISKKEEAK